MKFISSIIFVTVLTSTAYAQEAVVDVTLNPMGDFKAKTRDVQGSAVVKGDEIFAQNIVVNLKTLKTGVELRDTHTQKHLDSTKFPTAVLVSAQGKGGKGVGKIRIRGVEKEISGSYKISGKTLIAEFDLNIADFGIKDINYMGVGVEDEVKLHVSIPIK